MRGWIRGVTRRRTVRPASTAHPIKGARGGGGGGDPSVGLLVGGWSDELEGGGRSRAPSLCPATVSLTPSASFNGTCNRQQPPPTALATSSNRLWGRLWGPFPSGASRGGWGWLGKGAEGGGDREGCGVRRLGGETSTEIASIEQQQTNTEHQKRGGNALRSPRSELRASLFPKPALVELQTSPSPPPIARAMPEQRQMLFPSKFGILLLLLQGGGG